MYKHSVTQNTNTHQPKKGSFFNGVVQPKLTINEPGDASEKEADAVANKVIRMPKTAPSPVDNKPFFSPPTVSISNQNSIKREALKKEHKEDETQDSFSEIQSHQSFDAIPPPPDNKKVNASVSIQRKCAHCEEEEKKMQRKEINNDATVADSSTENYISSLNGKGRSLTSGERKSFEPRMSYDFSNVQLHTDSEANQSAKSINALAYTHRNNIVFSAGQYQHDTDEGKKLMAHELTHVVQQGNESIIRKKTPPPPAPEDLFKPFVESAITDNQISSADWIKLREKAAETRIDRLDLESLLSRDFGFQIDREALMKIITGKEAIYLKLINIYSPKIIKTGDDCAIEPNPIDTLIKIILEDSQIDKEEFQVLRDFFGIYGQDKMSKALLARKFSVTDTNKLLSAFGFDFSQTKTILSNFPLKVNKDTKTGLLTTVVDLSDVIINTILDDKEIQSNEFDQIHQLLNGMNRQQAGQYLINHKIEALSADLLAKEFTDPNYDNALKKRSKFVFQFKLEGKLWKLTEQTITNLNLKVHPDLVKEFQPIAGRQSDKKSAYESIYAYKFPSGVTEDAEKANYSFAGHQFILIISESILGGDRSIIERIDYALSVIPAKFFVLIKTLVVDPGYNKNVAADTNPNGTITLYLLGAGINVPQKDLNYDIVHEFGHLISFHEASTNPKFWNNWDEAIIKDRLGVSMYGFSDHYEDFSETWTLYFSGGGSNKNIRSKYPNRFRIIDQILSR